MESGEVERGGLKRLGHGHLGTHGNSIERFLNSSLSSGLCLFGSHSLGHALSNHLRQHLLVHTGIHRLLHGITHGVGDGIADGARDGIAKVNGGIGVKPLIRAEETRGMLPTTRVMRTEHKLLGDGVHLLSLIQTQIVGRHIILVHQHQIIQILVAGG